MKSLSDILNEAQRQQRLQEQQEQSERPWSWRRHADGRQLTGYGRAMGLPNIVQTVLAFMDSHPGHSYHDFYVGIAKDYRQRLFGNRPNHHVNEASDTWLVCRATEYATADEAEGRLLEAADTEGTRPRGAQGGGDPDCPSNYYVYCYLTNSHTHNH